MPDTLHKLRMSLAGKYYMQGCTHESLIELDYLILSVAMMCKEGINGKVRKVSRKGDVTRLWGMIKIYKLVKV